MSSSESPAQPARSCPSTTVKVSPCRRSSAVSPTHKSGWSPWRRTAATFLLISSSVSRKMCRRSECPSSTRRHPSSASIVGEISPVNAPWGCQWQFCAPSPTAEPPSTSATAASAVKGGHTTTSTPRGRLSPSRTDWASARASAKPPCIFQLPTTRGVRMTYPRRGASPPFRSLPPGIVAPAKPALEPRSSRMCSSPIALRQGCPEALPRLHDGLAVARHRRPVEALAVVGPARNQVQVEVRHRLEGGGAVGLQQVQAIRLERLPDRQRDPPGRHRRRLEVLDVDLEERRRVALRHHEAVAGAQRIDVHEGERALVLVDPHRGDLAVPDLAEHAVAHRPDSLRPRRSSRRDPGPGRTGSPRWRRRDAG